jgi:hydroxymethylbilane synthase
MKDMPVQMTKDLEIVSFLEREDPRDVLVSNTYKHLSEIPLGKKIGTASLRRQSMVKLLRSDLFVETLRGNVNSRLSKLDAGNYDAIILAAAGLKRLGFIDRIKYYFSIEESLPAIGQGIIGIQCRSQDKSIKAILEKIDHYPTHLCITAERLMNSILGGNCHSPIGGHASIEGEIIRLRGCVYSQDGTQCHKSESKSHIKDIEKIAHQVGSNLKDFL